jgi:hypothetical protein
MNYFYVQDGHILRQIAAETVKYELRQWDLDEGDIDSWFENPTKFACKMAGLYVVTMSTGVMLLT